MTTGAVRRAKLQSDHSSPTNQHPTFNRPGCSSRSPNRQCQRTI